MDTQPQPPTPLVAFILEALEARGWSQRRLAEVADLSHGALSRVLRGIATPETATVERIADALGVPRLELLKLLAAEPTNLVAVPEADPEVAYIVRRLERLTSATRKQTLNTIKSLLDTVTDIEERQWEIARQLRPNQQTPRDIHYDFISIYHKLRAPYRLLKAARNKEEQLVLKKELGSSLQLFRLLLSDLYTLPVMSNLVSPSVLARLILQFIDAISIHIQHEGRPQQKVWDELGGGVVDCLGYILLLQAELGYYVLDEVTAREEGMDRYGEGIAALVQAAQRLLDDLAAKGQLWASAL